MTRAARLQAVVSAALVSCASGPRAPDWQLDAHDSLQRSIAAYLAGDARVEAAEFDRARRQIARTGRIDLLARAELTRCAARVASLVFDACEGFEALRADAAAPERAYADHLRAHVQPADVPLLPPAQRVVAAAGTGGEAALRAIDDPLSRLVAAGVLFQAGHASPQAIALAVDTASAQGWRRPLLAWLGVQEKLAQQAGDAPEAQRLRRRMQVVEGGG